MKAPAKLAVPSHLLDTIHCNYRGRPPLSLPATFCFPDVFSLRVQPRLGMCSTDRSRPVVANPATSQTNYDATRHSRCIARNGVHTQEFVLFAITHGILSWESNLKQVRLIQATRPI